MKDQIYEGLLFLSLALVAAWIGFCIFYPIYVLSSV